MTQLHVFHSTIPSVNVIFPNGKPAIFVNGVYRTSDESEIAMLTREITAGHPHLAFPVNEVDRVIDSEMVDPMNALRAKIIAEFLAQQERALDASTNISESAQEPVKPANSNDIAVAAAGGSGAVLAASLSKLHIKKS